MMHELKIETQFFEAIINGDKTFEIRKADRDYRVDDRLRLREWTQWTPKFDGWFDRGSFTDREIIVRVVYIADYAQVDHVVLGIRIEREFTIGDKVLKAKGYRYPGVVVAVFPKLDGEVRLVVECTAPDCKGMLHIFSEKDLKHDG